jgi:hypothetical protein
MLGVGCEYNSIQNMGWLFKAVHVVDVLDEHAVSACSNVFSI